MATILVVDDEPELRASVRAMLESYDYQVVEAGDSNGAVAALVESRPDLILTDIYMPGADGIELMTALLNWPEPIPVIAMSGGQIGTPDPLEMAKKLGAVGIIDKPFRISNLLEMIDRVLAGRGTPPRR
jgi:two-component system, NtrC family, nitrogen regulation response regulator NtrX